jgi:hypothetical protein
MSPEEIAAYGGKMGIDKYGPFFTFQKPITTFIKWEDYKPLPGPGQHGN